MSRWRWIALFLVGVSCEDPRSFAGFSVNDTSPAKILWQAGLNDYQRAHYSEALYSLLRLTQHYTGQAEDLKAHLLIAKCLLELERPVEAVEPLQTVIATSRKADDRLQARIWLAQAFIQLRKFQQANLVVMELERTQAKRKLSGSFLLEKWLLHAQIAIGFDRMTDASRAIETAELQISQKTAPKTVGKIFLIKLKLKNKQCAAFPSMGLLTIQQLRDQLDRRGTCLLEALSLFHKILGNGDLGIVRAGAAETQTGWSSYDQICGSPPGPPARVAISGPPTAWSHSLQPTSSDHTASATEGPPLISIQKIRYQAELADQLLQDCRHKVSQTLEFLETWQTGVPSLIQNQVTDLIKNMRPFCIRGPQEKVIHP